MEDHPELYGEYPDQNIERWKKLIMSTTEEIVKPCSFCGGPCYVCNTRLSKRQQFDKLMKEIERSWRQTDPGWRGCAMNIVYSMCRDYHLWNSPQVWDRFKLEHGEFATNGTRYNCLITHAYDKACDAGWCVRLDEDKQKILPRVKCMTSGSHYVCWYESSIYEERS
jgi:hypothetical protein